MRCPSCGAPSPLLARTSTCAYCLEPLPLPADVAEPLAAHVALGEQIEHARQRFAAARRRAQGPPWLSIGITAAFALIGVIGVAGPIGYVKSQPESGAMLSVGIMVIVYGGIVAGFGVGVLRGMRNARLRLARLPFVTVHATDRLAVTCPSCGAALPAASDAVTVRCGHCQTESLLPAALIPERLQQRHARILQLRTRQAEVQDIPETINDTISRSVGYAMVTIGVLGFLLFVLVGMEPTFAPHLQGSERVMSVLCSGGMLGGIFTGAGILSIRGARRKR